MYGSERFELAPDDEEFMEVNLLVQETWREGLALRDGDGIRLRHTAIQVVKVEKIQNSRQLKQYSREKDLLESHCNIHGDFTPVHKLVRSSGPVWTADSMKTKRVLRRNISSSLNEHYLFHGTTEDRASSIVENGFSMDHSRERSLLGPALYFAESSTKADMYADDKRNRTIGLKHMFLVRVPLGEAFLRKGRSKRTLKRPPCKHCLQETCFCGRLRYCHSAIGDCDKRPFRVFAVYKSTQCYPEYLITYRRL